MYPLSLKTTITLNKLPQTKENKKIHPVDILRPLVKVYISNPPDNLQSLPKIKLSQLLKQSIIHSPNRITTKFIVSQKRANVNPDDNINLIFIRLCDCIHIK